MAEKISPNVEPETRRFLEQANAAGGKPLWELSPRDARKVLIDLQSGEEVEKLPADIEDRTLPGGPENKGVSVRIVRPKGRTDALPVIMHFHGGGWVLGDKNTHDRLVRELAHGAQAAVVFVNYTPAPDAQYPTQIEEAYAATKWIAENGKSLNLDTSKFVVLGDSVGGNMAAAVTMMARDRGGPRIDYQLLFYPVTDANFDTGSYKEFATGHWLARDAMKWFWDNYLPDKAKRAEPYASPLRASNEQLKGLPPAHVMVGENDVLRDEVEAYAHKLAQAGVPVTATRYLGTIHDFVLLNPITDTPAPRGALRQAIDVLRKVFGREERAERRPPREGEAAAPVPH
ncbi:alpha/beta hydrolase [Pyxidicoccus parkwayensis]|uniref:Alpha/beta hydrolase n=1 Tax=Pyxidicoccus parkwayensis TaxID=2813578 RepID=A0ABX7NUX8_9BACT|nr:alpha/beta hydrolase [Pyxidicoccus parkwaysis]QSQ22727.1 alpha/beta hydrolase [Pyxidicoccus parkwaysis]